MHLDWPLASHKHTHHIKSIKFKCLGEDIRCNFGYLGSEMKQADYLGLAQLLKMTSMLVELVASMFRHFKVMIVRVGCGNCVSRHM